VIDIDIRVPVAAEPGAVAWIEPQGVVMVDSAGQAHVWVASGEAALVALVALAHAIALDPATSERVRRVAAGVYAALGIDVPTDPGVR
jgi:hypothetical protein